MIGLDKPNCQIRIMEENKKPDWSIGELYEKSFKIVKENKILWFFGAALAGLGSNFNSGGDTSGDSSSLQELFKQNPQESSNQVFSQVLGEATSSPFKDVLSHTLSQVSIPLLIILGISVVLTLILAIVIGLVYQSWLKSSLIISTDLASKNQKPTIKDSSFKAFPTIKSMIWLDIIPFLVFVLATILAITVITLGFAKGDTLIKIIFGILTLVFIGAFMYNLIMLLLTQIWGSREVALNQKSGFSSFKRGWHLSKVKFWPTLLLGLVNTILTGIIIGLPLVVIFGFLVGGFASLEGYSPLGFSLLMFGSLFLLIFALGFLLLAGILNAFKATVWTLAFNAIKNKYEK